MEEDIKFVDIDVEIDWIVERTGLDRDIVLKVMDADYDYLVESGIISTEVLTEE